MNKYNKYTMKIALHHLGFRPFFLMAGIFAVLAMLMWMWSYHQGLLLPGLERMGAPVWHAHEMIYGYGMAVIAGFLLTAVRNWTGVQTLHGLPLLLLTLCWCVARIMPLLDFSTALYWMAVFDLVFNACLCASLLYPIAKVRQWKQLGVWSKVLLLFIGNALFYMGLFGQLGQGIEWGLLTGLYLLISMILLMGRRVIPFFIEKGIEQKVKIKNPRWIDITSLIFMLAFIVFEVFLPYPGVASGLALLLFIIHVTRLYYWHTPGIWSKPMLWVLYVAYAWLVLGFALKGLMLFLPINPMLAIHAFAVGGIGLMSTGMMARVSLGHTGREVYQPGSVIKSVFYLLFISSLVRVLFPLFAPGLYTYWVGMSQVFWVVSFIIFLYMYFPILVKPRIDNEYG